MPFADFDIVGFSLSTSSLGTFAERIVDMICFLLAHAGSLLLDLIWLRRRAEQDKDIDILLLRQPLQILQRKQPCPPHISRWEKLTLLVLARNQTVMRNSARSRLSQVIFLFKPETLLKWHCELVRRQWTFHNHICRGRPCVRPELEARLLRLA